MSAAADRSQDQARPRAKSSFSLHSDKSRDSPSRSKHEKKDSLSERKKPQHNPTTKANPNAAMNEAQPVATALEKPTLQSLRSFQHTDSSGHLIVDPDLSNPTRSRWERPLDTIRSFEAAIDSEYRRRAQAMRSDQTDVMSGYGSRRSSYYGARHEQNHFSRTAHYGQAQASRESYENGYGMGGPVGGPPQRMRYGGRMQSDPEWHKPHSNNVYPNHAHQQSRDTANTSGSNGSHSDGPYSIDPGSDNSFIERAGPVTHAQSEFGGQYGSVGFGRGPEGFTPTLPPRKAVATASSPSPTKQDSPQAPMEPNYKGSSPTKPSRPNILTKNSSEKRKSWFKRRFSKE